MTEGTKMIFGATRFNTVRCCVGDPFFLLCEIGTPRDCLCLVLGCDLYQRVDYL